MATGFNVQEINCPTCAAPVPTATRSARVANCPYCQTTFIVNADAVEALGKMALLADTPSCLAIGWPAKCLGKEIVPLGRIQYQYESGIWDEWWVQYVDTQEYAWISQDEGEYMLERPLPAGIAVPDFDSVMPGDQVHFGKRDLWVEEKDSAQLVGMQGELPRDIRPGQAMRYMDLTDNEVKVTIEYFDDGTHEAFQGRYLKSDQLEAQYTRQS